MKIKQLGWLWLLCSLNLAVSAQETVVFPGVEVFPGLVEKSEPRLKNVKVEIDGRYEVSPEALRITAMKTPWMRTGLYVSPGEKVTIKAPKGVEGMGYRIGGYHCRLNPKKIKKLLRAPEICVSGDLKPGENVVSSEYGGHLYILFQQGAPGKKMTFTVSGAVKSPDFVLGKSNPEQWKKEVAQSAVPYGEMVCDRIILTMPVASMRKVADPEEMMKYYDDMIAVDMNHYNGLTDNNPDLLHRSPTLPWRLVFDIQVCAGAAHAGYPIACPMRWADRAIDLDMMRHDDRAWGFYHEIGHNNQTWCWKWGTLGEVSCNFPIFHARTRHHEWPTRVTKYQEYIDELVNTQIPDKDFDKAPFSHESRIIPFIQLAQEYGWELFRYLSSQSRVLDAGQVKAMREGGDAARRDFFCLTVARFTKQDMRPFFDAWGIKYSPDVAGMLAKYTATPDSFWKTFDQKKFPKL